MTFMIKLILYTLSFLYRESWCRLCRRCVKHLHLNQTQIVDNFISIHDFYDKFNSVYFALPLQMVLMQIVQAGDVLTFWSEPNSNDRHPRLCSWLFDKFNSLYICCFFPLYRGSWCRSCRSCVSVLAWTEQGLTCLPSMCLVWHLER